MSRPEWDEYFLNLCRAVSKRSHDKNTKNGAVIVNEYNRIVSTGYNGLPAGVKDDFWPTDRKKTIQLPSYRPGRRDKNYTVDKYMVMTHSEANAIVSAGQDLNYCILYTNLFPCCECAKLIITAGIKKIVFERIRDHVSWVVSVELLKQANIELKGDMYNFEEP
jgi:dCMP deaminase